MNESKNPIAKANEMPHEELIANGWMSESRFYTRKTSHSSSPQPSPPDSQAGGRVR
jgi:hypothetical protein